MSDIPMRTSDTYPQWVRQHALAAAAEIVAGQITDKTHPSVTIKRMEKLIPWAETYLKTGRFPPSDQ